MSYPSNLRKGDESKEMINKCVNRMITKYKIRRNIATILDDYNYQSTKSLKNVKKVIITQNEQNHYEKMKNNLPDDSVDLRFCNYDEINEEFDNDKIDIDHADFCKCWDTMKYGIFERLENNAYSDKAILRLTVCRRGTLNGHRKTKGMTVDKCIDKIEDEMSKIISNYSVKSLSMKEWELLKKDRAKMEKGYRDAKAYVYGNMINMIFLISRNK